MSIQSLHRWQVLALLVGIMLTACGGGAEISGAEISIGEINAQPPANILTGEMASLSIPVSGPQERQFEWTAVRGSLAEPINEQAVIYTAPDNPGPDVVTVEVTIGGRTSTKSLRFNVIAPTPEPTAAPTHTPLPEPSDTPEPTATPTPPPPTPTAAPLPEAIDCDHGTVVTDLFPQWAAATAAEERWVFVGASTEEVEEVLEVCEGVYAPVRGGQLAVHLMAKRVDNHYAFWGFGNLSGTDVTEFSEVCFWAYTESPNQTFWLQMKSADMPEDAAAERVQVFVAQPGDWTQICTPLTDFSNQDVDLTQLRDISLGFDSTSQNAEIWVDDFELR